MKDTYLAHAAQQNRVARVDFDRTSKVVLGVLELGHLHKRLAEAVPGLISIIFHLPHAVSACV
jgi:hypothetical protein